ncbi:lysophospholipase L1-like esterase [Bradyrhizobium sp. i1.4.4]|uniref:SGNH/GDSL hydrolase family protein n=1 Tax=Bradyrhizobium sp. LA6.10 TaxID=3156318 RepID=UPI003398EE23
MDAPLDVIPAQPIPFRFRMDRLASHLAGVGAIKIAAIGSSTTAGEGGIIPYPHRLESALRSRCPGRNFDVLNRGVGGEEAPDELRRMQTDVIAERPSVIIWQVGTNAAWKMQDLKPVAAALREGLALLADAFVDIILMDLQFTPAVLTTEKVGSARATVQLIEDAAAGARVPVNVFKRFELMRRWHEIEKISFDRLVDPSDDDRLHHSDWSATRMAEARADVMIKAAAMPAANPAA